MGQDSLAALVEVRLSRCAHAPRGSFRPRAPPFSGARVSGDAMSETPVGKAVEKVIWEVHQLEKILEAGAPSEDRVLEKLEHVVEILPSLREAAKASEAADDEKRSSTLLPVDVLRHVDEGKNPVGYMVDTLLAVGEANAACKGKSNVFARFHDALEKADAATPRTDAKKKDAEKDAPKPKPSPKKRKR